MTACDLPAPHRPDRAAGAMDRAREEAESSSLARGARPPGRRPHQGALRHKRAAVDRALAKFDPAARGSGAGRRVSKSCAGTRALPSVCSREASDAPAALHLIGDGDLLERRHARGPSRSWAPGGPLPMGEMARSLGRDLAACDVPSSAGWPTEPTPRRTRGRWPEAAPRSRSCRAGRTSPIPRQAPAVRTGQGLRPRRL